uniref:peptidylprolyl isomerase n=1 Tax=Clastoptera arizonana TaxID=38151 RepID=A0A1B6CIU3_9HEMI
MEFLNSKDETILHESSTDMNGTTNLKLDLNSEIKNFTNDSTTIIDNSAQDSSNLITEPELKHEDSDLEDDGWLDILGSGQLKKKVIVKGKDDSRPQRLDVCYISYEGKLEDETVVEKEDNKIVNLGDAEVIQGLDFALPLMDVGETAEIIIGPRFAYGNLGLPPNIPPNATLNYKVTLQTSEPEPEFTSLSVKERKTVGNRKRERGNWWYSRKEYTLAIQCYRRALDYLDDIENSAASEDIQLDDKEVHDLLDDRLKVYNNLAASQMKIKAYDTALQSVSKVLRCQPTNVKALFRKSKILSAKGDNEEAIDILKSLLDLETDTNTVQAELNRLIMLKRKDTAKERDLYKKMFQINNTTESKKETKKPKSSSKISWGHVALSIAAITTGAAAIILKYKYFS